MKVWIPKPGDCLKLTADWQTKIHFEDRNSDIWDVLKPDPNRYSFYARNIPEPLDFGFVAGDELVADRLYVRQGADDFASMTFVVKHSADSRFIGARFWSKLADVNNIDAELTATGLAFGPFAKAKYIAEWREKNNPEALSDAKRAKADRAKFIKQSTIAGVEAIRELFSRDVKSYTPQNVRWFIEVMKNNSDSQRFCQQWGLNSWKKRRDLSTLSVDELQAMTYVKSQLEFSIVKDWDSWVVKGEPLQRMYHFNRVKDLNVTVLVEFNPDATVKRIVPCAVNDWSVVPCAVNDWCDKVYWE